MSTLPRRAEQSRRLWTGTLVHNVHEITNRFERSTVAGSIAVTGSQIARTFQQSGCIKPRLSGMQSEHESSAESRHR